MSVLVSCEEGLDALLAEDEVAAIVEGVLANEGVERPVEVSVSFVGTEEMHDLNRTWRGIDAPTDVLSFECDSAFGDEVPEGEVVELGDIILAPEVISAQAPGFGNTPQGELSLMLVHGTLHLLGYDHIEEDEAAVMETREDELLELLGTGGVAVAPTTNHAHDMG